MGTERRDVTQVLKIHHSHSLWGIKFALNASIFFTKHFSSSLWAKGIPGIFKHWKIRLLNEFVESGTWDSGGRTDYFLSKIACSHLRFSGVQGRFKALTTVYIRACGRTE